MDNLSYSTDARNVLNKFYGVDKLVYVEGDDDIPFWEIIFEKLADFSFQFEAAGGKSELANLANDIQNSKTDYLLAMDSDYDYILGFKANPSIIRTPGYSIENTLICTKTICKSLKTLLRLSSKETPHDLCQNWLRDIEKNVRRLVACDILNQEKGLGLSIISESSDRFMKSKDSFELCENKIQSFLGQFSAEFDENLVINEQKKVLANNFNFLDILRGHFLFSATLRFLKVQAKLLGRNISISKDMLYLAMIAVFEGIFNKDHPHFTYYKEHIEEVQKAYKARVPPHD